MEAAALFFRFKDNLNAISGAFNSKLEIRTMPYQTTVPIEVNLLADVLRQHGLEFKGAAPGVRALDEFRQWFLQNEQQVMDVMHKVLENKRAYMKTGEGTVLQKEMLMRRLEFFNETAHTLTIMMEQQQLGSPYQHSYPFLNA
ncbi:hypothetical protein [Botryobacter ruber]|uniref:hypothetical protein n=1 Tax=Botryobacter ruber TaxID=2171629 RepID=UPI000E0AF07F|nr:hypothetical protein [Botryobacter ruber]